MAKPSATGAGSPEQLINILTLTLTRQLNKTEFRELGNLGASCIITNRTGEVLQQLQLITTGIHVDEVDNDHPTDVAQTQLPRDLNGRLTVGPEHRFPRVRRASERTRVHINHREGLGGLDDHVATGGKVNPRLESISYSPIDFVMLEQLRRLGMGFHHNVTSLVSEERTHPFHSSG